MDTKKWSANGAGPRQVNAVNKALSSMRWAGKGRVEVTGVIGGEEHRCILTPMCTGGQSEFAAKAWDTLGETYNWTITADNAATIVKMAEALVLEIEKNAPIDDKRITPEQDAENKRQWAERDAQQSAAATKRAEEVAKIKADLFAKYPWANDVAHKGLSHYAQAAANIKRELSTAFPGITFSVKSEGYSMGNGVNIGWTLGPTTEQVKAISDKYQEGNFNGMEDIYEYDHSAMSSAVGAVLGSAKYVSENRHYPEGLFDRIKADIAAVFTADEQQIERTANQTLARTAFLPGEQYERIEWPAHANDPEIVKTHTTTRPPRSPTDGAAGWDRNDEHDGIEVRFPQRPDENVLNELRGAGFHWHRRGKYWYAKDQPHRRAAADRAVNLANATEPALAVA